MTRGDRLSADLPDFVRELQLHDVAHPDEIVDMQLVSGPTNLTLYIYIYVYIYIYQRLYIFKVRAGIYYSNWYFIGMNISLHQLFWCKHPGAIGFWSIASVATPRPLDSLPLLATSGTSALCEGPLFWPKPEPKAHMFGGQSMTMNQSQPLFTPVNSQNSWGA